MSHPPAKFKKDKEIITEYESQVKGKGWKKGKRKVTGLGLLTAFKVSGQHRIGRIV